MEGAFDSLDWGWKDLNNKNDFEQAATEKDQGACGQARACVGYG
jgi:hypothetical protein